MRYYFFFFAILFFGCKNPRNEINVIEINAEKTKEFALSEIADTVIAIPLETNSECLMTVIRKVKFSDEYIYVADKQFLYRFDYSGRFINKVNKVGRGPGEIMSFTDFFIEQDSDVVGILAYGKLQRYHGNGTLIEEIPIKGSSEQALVVETSLWINTIAYAVPDVDGKPHNISQIVRLNQKHIPADSITVLDIKLEFGFAYINPGAVFYSYMGNSLYFYYPSMLIEPVTHDTLFLFEGNKLIPAYKLDFGDKLYELNRSQKAEKGVPPYKKFRINSIFITSHFLFSSYSVEDSDYFLCYNTTTGKIYNMGKGFLDDTYNTGDVQLRQFNFATNKMFFTKDGYEVAGKVEGVDENSNPVIFIVKLKD